MREQALAARVGSLPLLEHHGLDAPHRLVFRDTRVRHAVEVTVEQQLLVLRRQVAVARQPLVVRVRHEVEDVFLEVGAGAADGVHLSLANHLGERDSQLRRAHRACERHHHRSTRLEVGDVGERGVVERRGVEVAVVALDEGGNRTQTLALVRDRRGVAGFRRTRKAAHVAMPRRPLCRSDRPRGRNRAVPARPTACGGQAAIGTRVASQEIITSDSSRRPTRTLSHYAWGLAIAQPRRSSKGGVGRGGAQDIRVKIARCAESLPPLWLSASG